MEISDIQDEYHEQDSAARRAFAEAKYARANAAYDKDTALAELDAAQERYDARWAELRAAHNALMEATAALANWNALTDDEQEQVLALRNRVTESQSHPGHRRSIGDPEHGHS